MVAVIFVRDPKVSISCCIDGARMKLVFGVYCYFRYVFAIYICNNCRDDGSVRQRKGDDMRCVCNDGPKMAM